MSALRRRLACAGFALAPVPASAHVKWFVPFDLAQAPVPVEEVASPFFLALLVLSLAAGYACFVLDRRLERGGAGATVGTILARFERLSEDLVRIAAGAFFILLWGANQFREVPMILTPDLPAAQAWVPWLQFGVGLSALSRTTLPLMALGIVVLFLDAAWQHGFYHLLDYMVFLGVAYFLAAVDEASEPSKRAGFQVLYAATAFTLLWGAIEKFAYPDRFLPLLREAPGLLMGLSPQHYIVLAGFVEFNVTFLMFGAASVFARLVALGLNSIFVLAAFRFGWTDAVGHLLLIAILLVLVIRGPREAGRAMLLPQLTVGMEAYVMTALYLLSLACSFFLYYGLHFLAFSLPG